MKKSKKKLERLRLIDVIENWREVEGLSEEDDTPGDMIDELLEGYAKSFGSFIEAMISPNYRDNVMAQFIAHMHEGRGDWKSYKENGEDEE
jgi:hypothetical protein